jgi:hypothetical protein
LNAIPPPAPPVQEKEGDRYSIKTSRPHISIGIQLTALISALSSEHLNKYKARSFLTWLQNEMVPHKDDGPLEPMLISVPAPRALDLAFQFAIVEGKAYSTGKQIFEAENQAAVSGACGLKIQLDLDHLVGLATSSDALRSSSNTNPRYSSLLPPKAPSTSSGSTGPSLKMVCACLIPNLWTVVMRYC